MEKRKKKIIKTATNPGMTDVFGHHYAVFAATEREVERWFGKDQSDLAKKFRGEPTLTEIFEIIFTNGVEQGLNVTKEPKVQDGD